MTVRQINPGRNLPQATAVGVGLLGLLWLSLAFNRWAFVAYVALLALVATRELVAMFEAKGIHINRVVLPAVALAIANSYWQGIGAGVVCLVVAILIGWAAELRRGVEGYSTSASAFTFVMVYIGAAIAFAADLARQESGVGLVWTLVLLTAGSDTGGYFAGILAGRHPMAPKISPKKSWEGFAGSLVMQALLGTFVVPMLIDIAWWQGLAVGILMTVSATAGDLVESAIKRDTGTKDSGDSLPGHGGVLDRIDGLLINAPLAWLCFVWVLHV